MRFSLVIPCFNEEQNLVALREACERVLEIEGAEVIVVNNGSSDSSQKILETIRSDTFRVVELQENAGYGGGILAGLRECRGEIVGWTHADLQTDPADCIQGLERFNEFNDEVFVKGARYGRPLIDRIFSGGMGFFESVLFRTRLREINAQPTMFPRELLHQMRSPPSDFSLDLYTYVTAIQLGYPVARFPVQFGPRRHGLSKWNVDWKSRMRFIRRTVSYSVDLRKTVK